MDQIAIEEDDTTTDTASIENQDENRDGVNQDRIPMDNHEEHNGRVVVDHPNTTGGNDRHHDHIVPNRPIREYVHLSIKAVLMTFFTLIAGCAIAALCAINDHHVERIEKLRLGLGDLFHLNKFPNDFFTIVLLTIAFAISLLFTVLSIWSMIEERSFCYRALLCVAVTAIFFSYVSILKMPTNKMGIDMKNRAGPSLGDTAFNENI
ncbi:hypothetical protein LOK49_LG01G00194 [Camellia lanceoleosa]|uniref:Uncharacterized protein n=1 Tax=Camellia lanceoleosa TaxID=1840588 RepID=A0ACC0J5W0_9ERIC|nr:hypothetical protein LOK49_LG01G00194 [Camellia lanceoleosa]